MCKKAHVLEDPKASPGKLRIVVKVESEYYQVGAEADTLEEARLHRVTDIGMVPYPVEIFDDKGNKY